MCVWGGGGGGQGQCTTVLISWFTDILIIIQYISFIIDITDDQT